MSTHASPNGFQFTPDQLRMLQSQQGEPLRVEVVETKKIYLVVEEGALPTLNEDYIRQGLAHAAEQASQGEEAEWNTNEIKAAARRLLAQRGK